MHRTASRHRQPQPSTPPHPRHQPDHDYWRGHPLGRRLPCARDTWCTDPRTENDQQHPAWTRTVFCRRDLGRIHWALRKIPELYIDLWLELGQKPQRGEDRVSGSKAPPIPVRPEIDALLCETEFLLSAWAERVRCAAGLIPADTQLSRRQRRSVSAGAAARLLAQHLPVLVTLPKDPVAWSASLRRVREELAAEIDAGIITGYVKLGGWASLISDASGADAGENILNMYRRMRHALGLNTVVYRLLAPCSCGAADIRQEQGDEYAECHTCRRLYNRRDYARLAQAHREASSR